MGEVIAKLMVGIMWKLMTERVISNVIALSLDAAAKSTKFTDVDDKMAATVAEALGVTLSVPKTPPTNGAT